MILDSIERYVGHLNTSEKVVAGYLILEYIISNQMPFDAIMDYLGEREQGRVLEAFGKYMIHEF